MAYQMVLFDHVGMTSSPAAMANQPMNTEPDPEARLARIVAMGLTRLAVPHALGGQGAQASVLAAALQTLASQNPAEAWVAWSQCLVIEALVHSPNVALREHLLPDLLDGGRAGAVSWAPELGLQHPPRPVGAHALARGWHLSGQLAQVPNLQWSGYALLCPTWFKHEGSAPDHLGWALLRSEENGLHHEWDLSRTMARQAAGGTVRLHNVYFREDELLGDEALSLPLRLLDQRLRAAWWAGVMQRSSTQLTEHPADWSL